MKLLALRKESQKVLGLIYPGTLFICKHVLTRVQWWLGGWVPLRSEDQCCSHTICSVYWGSCLNFSQHVFCANNLSLSLFCMKTQCGALFSRRIRFVGWESFPQFNHSKDAGARTQLNFRLLGLDCSSWPLQYFHSKSELKFWAQTQSW